MITIQAFRSPDKQSGAAPEEYKTDEKAEEKAGKVTAPLGVLAVLAAVVFYIASFLPFGRAETEPIKENKSATDSDETALGADDEVTTGSLAAPSADNDNVSNRGDENGVASSYASSFNSLDWASLEFSSAERGAPAALLGPPGSGGSPIDSSSLVGTGAGAGVGAAGGSGGGGGSGGFGGSSGGDTEGKVGQGGSDDDVAVHSPPVPPGNSDPNPDPLPQFENRAPRLSGAIRLQEMVGFYAYFISTSALLAGASDPDGDLLSITDLAASRGTLTPVEGGWIYEGVLGVLGDVSFTYAVTDGKASVQQVANLMVLAVPPIGATDGNDNILGTPHDDVIDARGGDDNIDARGGNDIIHGGSGNDHIVGGDGNDVIFAGDGNDIVFAGNGDDIVLGGSGDDRLYGEAGNDIILGEDGDDLLVGGLGDDELIGGAGDDEIRGDEGNDVVRGGDGNDRIVGSSGNDVLAGDVGDDTIDGGQGDDVIADGGGADTVDAGEGNDHVVAALDTEADSYTGGTGQDTLDYSAATSGVTINMNEGTVRGTAQAAATAPLPTTPSVAIDMDEGAAQGAMQGEAQSAATAQDAFEGFERFIAGSGDDRFIAGETFAEVTGGAGNDIFEFKPGGDKHPEVVGRITDFTIGDKLYVSNYEIKYRDLDDLLDEIEDAFEDAYSAEGGEQPIRIRFDKLEERDITVIEVHDVNGDGIKDTYSVHLDGRHDVGLTFTIT